MPRMLPLRVVAIAFAAAAAFPVTALAQEPAPAVTPAAESSGDGRLPDGLFDQDQLVRIAAIEQVERERNRRAVGKLADLARNDAFADVRAAACRVLGTLEAKEQMELLVYLAAYDANADVRAAAARAVRRIEGQPEPEPAGPIFEQAPEQDPGEAGTDEGAGFPMPSLINEEPVVDTRHFAFGFGSMGGFGIAAFDVRGRIATGADALPWIGFEIGGGWTPPGGYPIVSGLTSDLVDDDIRWKLISGAAGLLLYFHRWHYIPIRGGFDPGQGPYAILGYGFEHLNDEGFFSWGIEIGLLYHPVVKDWIGNVTDCDGSACEDAAWPVIPFIRFSLHFYLV